jgi:Domain of unknown function (DUF5615)
MKLLADENFPRPPVELLRKRGHDVLWVRTDSPGLADRVLIDSDALRHSGVVLFRVNPAVPENLEPLVVAMLRADRECFGHVSIVTRDGIEMILTGGRSSRGRP